MKIRFEDVLFAVVLGIALATSAAVLLLWLADR